MLALLPAGQAALPPEVRVRLFEAHPGAQQVLIQGKVRLLSPLNQSIASERLLIVRQADGLSLQDAATHRPLLRGRRIQLRAERGTVSLLPVGSRLKQARRYEGHLAFEARDGQVAIWNRVPARTYVATVIGSETQPDWPLEALKAQAVLTQSRLARYKPQDALGDSTQQEAFLGAAYHRPETRTAVAAVWGQTLSVKGQTVTPYYHASCAGRTSDGAVLGASPSLGWLTGVHCPYCASAPFSRPTVSVVSASTLQKAFSGTVPVVVETDKVGRPLRVQTNRGIVDGYPFWIRLGQSLGWDKAPGTRFSLTPIGDKVRITSTGAGHGVGLCQWGAATLARKGHSYREILRFYFPNAALSGASSDSGGSS